MKIENLMKTAFGLFVLCALTAPVANALTIGCSNVPQWGGSTGQATFKKQPGSPASYLVESGGKEIAYACSVEAAPRNTINFDAPKYACTSEGQPQVEVAITGPIQSGGSATIEIRYLGGGPIVLDQCTATDN
jgi:hypothetical protein